VARSHQKRPQQQVAEIRLQARTSWTMTSQKPVSAETDKHDGRCPLQDVDIDPIAQNQNRCDNDNDRQAMAEPDWRQRPKYLAPAVVLQTDPDGKQPPHRRVEAVESAETRQRNPRPDFLHACPDSRTLRITKCIGRRVAAFEADLMAPEAFTH